MDGQGVSMISRFVARAALAGLILSLAGCGWLQHRLAGDSMVAAPKGPQAPPRAPDEAPVPSAAPQPAVQAAPLKR
jgi:hypothetical protein